MPPSEREGVPPRLPLDGAPPEKAEKTARLAVVDAMRAVALFGVLVMNLREMSGRGLLSAVQLDAVQGPLDRMVDAALLVLVDGTSLSAFSFLFGVSFTLLLEGAMARGGSFLPMYARRLVALAGFGVLNVTFAFRGDILIIDAALGGLLVIAVRLPERLVPGLGAALLFESPAGRGVHDVLAPAGRMALTNHLLYGVIGQALFFGWGLGLIGRIGSAVVLLISVGVYVLMLAASSAWLTRFRMGPAEWVWRILAHLEVRPLRRGAGPHSLKGAA
ncbi:MAG TPA: DUF418 domain-containing protein [Azospirillum sp.]|nr:DUF418 domain-containing protein [Azospirillum sp.]